MSFCFTLIIFIAITISADSSVPFAFLNHRNGTLHHFGIKTKTTNSKINLNAYLKVSFGSSKYACKLNAIEDPSPDLWYWCYVDAVDVSYCNSSDNNDYSFMLTNDEATSILVDMVLISIQNATNEITIQIDTFYQNNINEKYESLFPRKYAMGSTEQYEHMYDIISVTQTSVLINLNDVSKDKASNITIIEEQTDECAKDQEIPFVFVRNKPKTWQEAEMHCQTVYGTHLATINTEEKMDFTLEIGTKYNDLKAWIGFKNNNSEWIWIDGSSCEYVEDGICAHDPNWAQNEPNGLPNELCANTGENRDGYFNDIECSQKMAFLCNLNINASIVTNNVTNSATQVGNNNNNSMSSGVRNIILVVIFFVMVLAFVMLCIIGLFYLMKHQQFSVSDAEKNQKNEMKKEETHLENDSPQKSPVSNNAMNITLITNVRNDKVVSLSVNDSCADTQLIDQLKELGYYVQMENGNHMQTNTETDSTTDGNTALSFKYDHKDSKEHSVTEI